ncbi:hypothetical protein KR054_012085 [Drosophila jambulina]|nr:hypothetical protein KR054_012085 [Drosophila jambulina]
MHFPAFDDFYQRFLFLLPFVANFRSDDIQFNYDAPDTWKFSYPKCGGLDQSPIAISNRKALPVALPPLEFGLYDELFDSLVTITNNGHSVEFEVPATIHGVRPFVTGALLVDCYEAEAVHFHWGSPKSKGSEHVLDGRRYDLEMHIVHRNNKYLTLREAETHNDGIAVLAVLFKVVRTGPAFYQPGLSEIFSSLLHLGNFNSSYTLPEQLSLGSLLGLLDRGDFFTYKGSLTTPRCSPAVQWHVFADVLPISHRELPKFWQLRDQRRRPLLNNFRPLQTRENRPIFHRRPYLEQQLQEVIWL